MKKWMLFITAIVVILLLSACGNDSQPKEETETKTNDEANSNTKSLQLLKDTNAGEYLADSEGMTLYLFKKDEEDKSNCTEDCLESWPAFVADDFEVPDGFKEDEFDTITREDTKEEQVTYKGYPLYYFKTDQAKGDVTGQGVKDVWYVASDQSIQDHFKEQSASLEEGVDQVLVSLEALNSTVESSADDTAEINTKGKELSGSWEPIEEKVEEQDEEAYENIEKSLYPLIEEAQKDKPDVEKVKQLTKETQNQLAQFKEELASS